jgi:hypothetical protein
MGTLLPNHLQKVVVDYLYRFPMEETGIHFTGNDN